MSDAAPDSVLRSAFTRRWDYWQSRGRDSYLPSYWFSVVNDWCERGASPSDVERALDIAFGKIEDEAVVFPYAQGVMRRVLGDAVSGYETNRFAEWTKQRIGCAIDDVTAAEQVAALYETLTDAERNALQEQSMWFQCPASPCMATPMRDCQPPGSSHYVRVARVLEASQSELLKVRDKARADSLGLNAKTAKVLSENRRMADEWERSKAFGPCPYCSAKTGDPCISSTGAPVKSEAKPVRVTSGAQWEDIPRPVRDVHIDRVKERRRILFPEGLGWVK